jgi:hypothetical protein
MFAWLLSYKNLRELADVNATDKNGWTRKLFILNYYTYYHFWLSSAELSQKW